MEIDIDGGRGVKGEEAERGLEIKKGPITKAIPERY